MAFLRKKRVIFRARKIVKIPVRVKFRTFDGRKVSFKATKAIRRPTRVSFLARRKRRWY